MSNFHFILIEDCDFSNQSSSEPLAAEQNPVKASPFKFIIGRSSWVEEIRFYTTELNLNYWSRFRPLSLEEIADIERSAARRLPDDFKEFLGIFGCGNFPEPFGGNIYTPDDFVHGCHGHLFMILGSSKWASDEQQRGFYRSHGALNPAPEKYTQDALMFGNVNLLDLLQFGTNGGCCYHQLFVGQHKSPLGYCLLTPEKTMEDESPSFSEGLKLILKNHWNWGETEDLPPLGSFRFEPE